MPVRISHFVKVATEKQYHPHPLKLAFYEEDLKKREKMYSLKNLDPNELSPKAEKKVQKAYKATLIEPPFASIETEPLKQIIAIFSLKNTGEKNWPEKMKVECVEGAYKGLFEDVKSLKIGEVGAFEIPLQALKEMGKYESKWKMAYDEEGKRKHFGPKISFEVVVIDPEIKKKQQAGIEWQNQGFFISF